MDRTRAQQAEADKKFSEARVRYRYDVLYAQVDELWGPIEEIARAILSIPSTDRICDGIRAAASLVLNEDCENAYEMAEVLREMAQRAGFTLPVQSDGPD